MNPVLLENFFTLLILYFIAVAVYYVFKINNAPDLERERLRTQRRTHFRWVGILGAIVFGVALLIAVIIQLSK